MKLRWVERGAECQLSGIVDGQPVWHVAKVKVLQYKEVNTAFGFPVEGRWVDVPTEVEV
jgi:hypothetical protein